MTASDCGTPMRRVHELLEIYGASDACAAALFCDRHDPARVAYQIVAKDLTARSLTYGELREESERVAAGLLALGVRPGERVATLMGKSRDYLVTLMAIWRLGAVHVPLFTAFAPPSIAMRLKASGALVVVCDESQREKLQPSESIPIDAPWRVVTNGTVVGGDLAFRDLQRCPSPVAPAAVVGGDSPIIHIFTSGTTGAPKGVLVPLRAAASFQIYAEYGLGVTTEDRFWNAADPGWAYGLYFGVLSSFTTGVESFLYEGGFSAEATLAVLERYRITNLTAAPTVYRSIRAAAAPIPRGLALRCLSSAGEPLTPEVNDWARTEFGMQVHDHYGQTEAGMLINNHHHPDLRRVLKSGSMGHPMPGWSPAILNADSDTPATAGTVGRVAMDLAASPLAWFEGYADDGTKSAEKFSTDGRWYLTGDVGCIDESGYFYFSSREDDVIIMAGYRIGPADVEAVILGHPAVVECAVVARPDQIRGEILEAAVVLAPGHLPSDALTREIQAKVKTEFAAHAYPRRVHYVTAMPKTPSGKVQRFVVRQQLREDVLGASSD